MEQPLNGPKPVMSKASRAFTLVELIAVIAIISLLIALLLPALRIARLNSQWAASQNNMRQVGTLMQGYTSDNRDTVLPSQFDHRPPLLYKGAMRAPTKLTPDSPAFVSPPIGLPLVGTWADILHSTANLGTFMMPLLDGNGDTVLDGNGEPMPGTYNYRHDSPDRVVYREYGGFEKNILRSSIPMDHPHNWQDPATEATPWGTGAGAREVDHPGYFAANNFFTARPPTGQLARYWPSSQIRFPSASIYLIDSRAGETIDPLPDPWMGSDRTLCQVDFRNPGGSCIILCLDGHVQTEVRWDKIEDLQGGYYTAPAQPPTPPPNDPDPRGLRVSNLDRSDNPGP